MDSIVSFGKKYFWSFIIIFLIGGITFYLAYFYPLVYDDVHFAYSSIDKINWESLSVYNMRQLLAHVYNMNGRVGHGFIYILIHIPLLFALLSSIMILCIYGFFPYIISSLTYKKFSVIKWIYIFGTVCAFSLFFPWFFYILNDFFNRTEAVTYILPVVGYIICAMFCWYQIMMLKPVKGNIIIYIILYLIGFSLSIHSELLTLYGIGMLLGIFFLATIRYKTLPNFPKTMIPLFLGILTGAILCFTSPGMLSRIFGTNNITLSSNNLYIIFKEVLLFSLVLLSFVIVIYAILWHKKQLILSKNSKDENEFIYRSLYLFCLWLGFIVILYIGRIPYFRTFVIATTVLPLVYLIILGGSKLFSTISFPKITVVIPLLIIIYTLYVTIYNIDLMNKIIKDFQKQIVIAQETNTDLIIPVYDAPFKHIYVKLGNKYFNMSEMGSHLNPGSSEQMQKDGIRIFYHVLTDIQTTRWKMKFYNYTGEIANNQSVTNIY